jgi:hypothetical protein
LVRLIRFGDQTLPKITDDLPRIAGAPGDDASGRYAPYDVIPRQELLHHSAGHDPRISPSAVLVED